MLHYTDSFGSNRSSSTYSGSSNSRPSSWSDSVQDFLKSIKLEQYLPLFASKDLHLLSDCQAVNDQYLINLGIQLAGHRRRILQRLPNSTNTQVSTNVEKLSSYYKPLPSPSYTMDDSSTNASITIQTADKNDKPTPRPRKPRVTVDYTNVSVIYNDSEKPTPKPRATLAFGENPEQHGNLETVVEDANDTKSRAQRSTRSNIVSQMLSLESPTSSPTCEYDANDLYTSIGVLDPSSSPTEGNQSSLWSTNEPPLPQATRQSIPSFISDQSPTFETSVIHGTDPFDLHNTEPAEKGEGSEGRSSDNEDEFHNLAKERVSLPLPVLTDDHKLNYPCDLSLDASPDTASVFESAPNFDHLDVNEKAAKLESIKQPMNAYANVSLNAASNDTYDLPDITHMETKHITATAPPPIPLRQIDLDSVGSASPPSLPGQITNEPLFTAAELDELAGIKEDPQLPPHIPPLPERYTPSIKPVQSLVGVDKKTTICNLENEPSASVCEDSRAFNASVNADICAFNAVNDESRAFVASENNDSCAFNTSPFDDRFPFSTSASNADCHASNVSTPTLPSRYTNVKPVSKLVLKSSLKSVVPAPSEQDISDSGVVTLTEEVSSSNEPKTIGGIDVRRKGSVNQLNKSTLINYLTEQNLITRRIYKEGTLFIKPGIPLREFQKRMFTLSNGQLQQGNETRNAIDCISMVLLRRTTDSRQGKAMYCFELATLKDRGRTYIFGAETEDDYWEWMRVIAESFAPEELYYRVGSRFDSTGYLYIKDGSVGVWRLRWISLYDRELTWEDSSNDMPYEVDLRKVVSIKYQSEQVCCPLTMDSAQCFVIDLPGQAYYMCGEYRKITEMWYNSITSVLSDTDTHIEQHALTAQDLPVIVDKCINYITLHGLTSEGVYRLSGNHLKVLKLMDDFKADPRSIHIKQSDYSVHDVANVVKRYFRGLAEPLLTRKLHLTWVQAATIDSNVQKLETFKDILTKLPPVNYQTLKHMVAHLKSISDRSDETKMSVGNLSAVFGPTLMSTSLGAPISGESGASSTVSVPSYTYTNREITVIACLINNYYTLFEVSDAEAKKEEKILEAVAKLRESFHPLNKPPAGDLLIPFYILAKSDKIVQLKVSSQMTAKDVVDHIVHKECLYDNPYWSLHESICDSTLVRPVHYSERILDVILRWSAILPTEDIGSCYLCLQDNALYKDIVKSMSRDGFTGSLFPTEVKFSQKKGFKSCHIEFSTAMVKYYKDSKITLPAQCWKVEDIVWYQGAEKKRSSPTKHSLTFIEKDHKYTRNRETPYLGNTLCCSTQPVLHALIAAMLWAEYPQGLIP